MVDNKTVKRLTPIRFAAVVFGFAVLGMGGWYMAADREVNELDDAARKSLGGTYVALADGVTSYELTGPSDGPVVVLIHGATIPAWDWDFQMDDLVGAGFQVLRYDKYGRGRSDRPNLEYDRNLYLRQLAALLDALGLKDPVDLVGHSLGGATATNFTSIHPKRVRSLVLVSPVVDSVDTRAPFIICGIPILGPFLVRTVMVNTLTDRAANLWKAAGKNSDRYERLFVRQTTYEGFESSVISMFRTDAVGDYRDAYRRVGELKKPVMLIWGTEDEDVTREDVDFVQQVIPDLRLRVLDGAGHSPNVDARERFNPLLLDFLLRSTD
jgi:pimeloyl-ACP methyl ester carboxylesterase